MNEIKFPQMTGLTSPNPLTLVCTKKADGTTNLSTISWWMPLSFNPNLFAVAINHGSHGGERLRETGDHNLYIMEVQKVYGDETETPLFAWKGYAEVNTAVRGTQA